MKILLNSYWQYSISYIDKIYWLNITLMQMQLLPICCSILFDSASKLLTYFQIAKFPENKFYKVSTTN